MSEAKEVVSIRIYPSVRDKIITMYKSVQVFMDQVLEEKNIKAFVPVKYDPIHPKKKKNGKKSKRKSPKSSSTNQSSHATSPVSRKGFNSDFEWNP